MILGDLESLLWAAGFFGNFVLIAVLLGRHRARHFPAFTAFLVGSVVRSLILMYLTRHYSAHAYFLVFWFLAILVDVVLELAVVYEIATHVFRPLGHWAPDTRRGMTLLIAGSLVTAGLLAWLATPVSSHWQESIVVKGSFFFDLLMSELFIGMVLLSVTVGLPWRTHVARIAQALGAYSLLDLVLEACHSLYGGDYQAGVELKLTYLRKCAYLICVAYWGITLWRSAPAPRELPAEARKQLRALQAKLAYDLYTLRGGRRP